MSVGRTIWLTASRAAAGPGAVRGRRGGLPPAELYVGRCDGTDGQETLIDSSIVLPRTIASALHTAQDRKRRRNFLWNGNFALAQAECLTTPTERMRLCPKRWVLNFCLNEFGDRQANCDARPAICWKWKIRDVRNYNLVVLCVFITLTAAFAPRHVARNFIFKRGELLMWGHAVRVMVLRIGIRDRRIAIRAIYAIFNPSPLLVTSCNYPSSGRSCLGPADLYSLRRIYRASHSIYCLGPAGLCKRPLGLCIALRARSIVSALRASVRRIYRASRSNSLGPCGPL